MEEGYMSCMRCRGQKKMYQVGNNAYSTVNSGGILVNCPMCNGEGKVKTLEQVMKEKKSFEESSPTDELPKRKVRLKKELSAEL
jgi:hypothetical protein